jgi:hypothetical protein
LNLPSERSIFSDGGIPCCCQETEEQEHRPRRLFGICGATQFGVEVNTYREILYYAYLRTELSTVEPDFAVYPEVGLVFKIGGAISF